MKPRQRRFAGGAAIAGAAAAAVALTLVIHPVSYAAEQAAPAAATTKTLSRSGYAANLRAYWLGQCLANYAGLTTENVTREDSSPLNKRPKNNWNKKAFYTDQDWKTQKGRKDATREFGPAIDFTFQDVCAGDDDMDVEYAYLHGMAETFKKVRLTPENIASIWDRHIRRSIWASNSRARTLMAAGSRPPTTGMNIANSYSLYIDAQLTTEMFGLLAPGMPTEALKIADLPIRTVAEGHSAHAAQFFVLLNSLAPLADKSKARPWQVEWMVAETLKYLPRTSKAAEIITYVLDKYRATTNYNDWEKTRNDIRRDWEVNPPDKYRFLSGVESSINLAMGVLALLYGRGDFIRTVQIGTLAGYDSDNQTASAGALLALNGTVDDLNRIFEGYQSTHEYSKAGPNASQGRKLSDKFKWSKTRDGLKDYLPADNTAEDTFQGMANRMLPLIDQAVRAAGGTVNGDTYTVPVRSAPTQTLDSLAAANPVMETYRRSANNQVRLQGGTVTTAMFPTDSGYDEPSSTTLVKGTDKRGFRYHNRIADGRESNFSGKDWLEESPYTAARAVAGEQRWEVNYSKAVPAHTVRVIFGRTPGIKPSAKIQIRKTQNGPWQEVPEGSTWSQPISEIPFLQTDLRLGQTVNVWGVRLVGPRNVGPTIPSTTMGELDVLSPPGPGSTP